MLLKFYITQFNLDKLYYNTYLFIYMNRFFISIVTGILYYSINILFILMFP